MSRVERIRTALQTALAPSELEVVDDSHRHAGHAGARDGRGHFNVRVVSAAFVGRRRWRATGRCTPQSAR